MSSLRSSRLLATRLDARVRALQWSLDDFLGALQERPHGRVRAGELGAAPLRSSFHDSGRLQNGEVGRDG